MKRLFITLSFIVLAIATALAQSFTIDDLTYTITDVENHYVSVSKSSTTLSGKLEIPSQIKYPEVTGITYTVTSVPANAFTGCTELTSIIVPNTITNIGEGAFSGCSGLTSITLPFVGQKVYTESDTYQYPFGYVFGTSSYTGGTATTQYYNPYNGRTGYARSTYYIPTDLKEVIITGGNKLPFHAFCYCTGISSVTIPNTVTAIDNYEFLGCSGLTSITIPNSVIVISNHAFNSCTSLASITIPNSVTTIGSGAFYECSELTSIDIPNSVITIGSGAFSSCNKLRYVTIPKSVTTIELNAFTTWATFCCEHLKKPDGWCYSYDNMTNTSYWWNNNRGTIYWGTSFIVGDFGYLIVDDNKVFVSYYWGDDLDVSIPSKVTYNGVEYYVTGICDKVFKDKQITSINIPDSVESIGNEAFLGCSSLESITLSNTLISIGDEAFSGCSGITTITIPNLVRTIGNSAFSGCTGITTITIPNLVRTIGDSAFEGCSGLASARLPDSLISIGNNTFKDCSSLTSITIPNRVKGIGEYTFANCTALTSAIFPDTLTSIGNYAFYGCSSLKTITIPNSVKTIGEYAFARCERIISMTIPNSVTSIGRNIFSGCNGLTSVILSNAITSISEYAFGDCVNLSTIKIPDSVTIINADAFRGCSGLKNVFIPKTVNTIRDKAFNNNNITFYCEPLNKPSGWVSYWNENKGTVYWGVSFIEDSVAYYITSETTVTITKYFGNKESFVVPQTVIHDGNNYNVVGIAENAFSDCSNLALVTILDNIETIEQKAFNNMGITFYCEANGTPDGWNSNWNNNAGIVLGGAKRFGDYLFYIIDSESHKVELVRYIGRNMVAEIPSSVPLEGVNYGVTSIGMLAFGNCDFLESVTIPNSMTNISNNAFKVCKALPQIVISNKVTTVGKNTFMGCNNLTIYCIASGKPNGWNDNWNPDNRPVVWGTKIVGDFIYRVTNSANLEVSVVKFEGVGTSVTIPSNPIINGVACNVTGIDNYAFANNSNLLEVVLPNSVKTIGGNAFSGCINLETINIGNSVEQIGANAFNGCENINTITISSLTPPIVDESTFESIDKFVPIYVSCSQLDVYRMAAYWGDFVNYLGTFTFSLIVQSDIHGSAEITRQPACNVPAIIKATGDYGYHFSKWNDGSTANPRTVTMTKDTVFKAFFVENRHFIELHINDAERGSVSGSGTFNYLTENRISAEANYGYHFSKWSDNITDNPRNVLLIRDTAFTAVFVPKVYKLQVASGNSEFGTVSGANSFDYKSVSNISATAAAHYHFVQWNDGNRQNPRQVTVERDTLFVATFGIDTFSVAAKCDTAMGVVSGAGLYSYGSAAKVEAKPAVHHHFVQWKNGAVQTTQEFVVEHDTTFEAVFAIDRHTVALAASDSLCGAVSGAGSYDYGASVQLQATPAANCYFTGWSDGVTTNPRVLTVEGDTNIVAEFESLPQFSIKAETAQAERGTVSGTGEYVQGSQATLSATAAEHYVFSQWADGYTDNPRTVRVIADATYTAVFEPMEYYVKLAQNNANMGMVSGDGVYSYGTVVSCLATPYPNYHFVQWSNGERMNPYEFVISEDVPLLTAYFAEGAATAIGDKLATEPTIYAIDKTIVVENATEDILVYDAMGRLVGRDDARNACTINVGKSGIYLVKVGNVVKRVVVE